VPDQLVERPLRIGRGALLGDHAAAGEQLAADGDASLGSVSGGLASDILRDSCNGWASSSRKLTDSSGHGRQTMQVKAAPMVDINVQRTVVQRREASEPDLPGLCSLRCKSKDVSNATVMVGCPCLRAKHSGEGA